MKTKPVEIRWAAMLIVQDMVPKKNRWGGIFITLYTNSKICLCANENIQHEISLFEPYIFKGTIRTRPGSTYLWVDDVKPFRNTDFKVNPRHEALAIEC